MPLEKSMLIAASGMKAQGTRLRIIVENVANANSTARTPGGRCGRLSQEAKRKRADRDDRHARGAAQLRGEFENNRRHQGDVGGNGQPIVLMSLLDGYSLFTPGEAPAFGDFARTVARALSHSFRLGLRIAMPFLTFGIVFYTGVELLARLMARMPIFFIALPAQIMLGLFLMLTTFPAAILWFLNHFQSNFTRLFLPE